MHRFFTFLVAAAISSVSVATADEGECGASEVGMNFSISLFKNETGGDWLTTFQAEKSIGDTANRVVLDLQQSVVRRCGNGSVVRLKGVVRADPVEFFDANREEQDRLTFHPRCGKNIAVLGNGRTAQKINLNDPFYSVVFTNRPLKDNEIFEVRIDKENDKLSHSIGIGIITQTPTEIDILPEMYKSPFAQMYHNVAIYSNETVIVKNYGRSTTDLKAGDRVGVMRNQFGTLHFFFNGVDQGPAASNTPSPVYGIFEIRGCASKATIVDASSPPS